VKHPSLAQQTHSSKAILDNYENWHYVVCEEHMTQPNPPVKKWGSVFGYEVSPFKRLYRWQSGREWVELEWLSGSAYTVLPIRDVKRLESVMKVICDVRNREAYGEHPLLPELMEHETIAEYVYNEWGLLPREVGDKRSRTATDHYSPSHSPSAKRSKRGKSDVWVREADLCAGKTRVKHASGDTRQIVSKSAYALGGDPSKSRLGFARRERPSALVEPSTPVPVSKEAVSKEAVSKEAVSKQDEILKLLQAQQAQQAQQQAQQAHLQAQLNILMAERQGQTATHMGSTPMGTTTMGSFGSAPMGSRPRSGSLDSIGSIFAYLANAKSPAPAPAPAPARAPSPSHSLAPNELDKYADVESVISYD
jgi:hypothetical protein